MDEQFELEDAMAESLAAWWYEANRELAPEYGLHVNPDKDMKWDDISEGNPVRRLLIAVCRKFISEQMVYTTDNGDASDEEVSTLVFRQHVQGGGDE